MIICQCVLRNGGKNEEGVRTCSLIPSGNRYRQTPTPETKKEETIPTPFRYMHKRQQWLLPAHTKQNERHIPFILPGNLKLAISFPRIKAKTIRILRFSRCKFSKKNKLGKDLLPPPDSKSGMPIDKRFTLIEIPGGFIHAFDKILVRDAELVVFGKCRDDAVVFQVGECHFLCV